MSAADVALFCGNAHESLSRSPQAKGDPPKFYLPLSGSSHTSLKVCNPSPSPVPEKIPVKVFDGCNGSTVDLNLSSGDTIGKLREKYLQKRPGFSGGLNLIYNGKPVSKRSTLAELGVRADAKFITFQKCQGG